jgi:hypothetical protein
MKHTLSKKVFPKCLAATLLFVAPLMATDTEATTPKFRFGLQASFVSPVGGMRDYALEGFGFGLSLEYELGEKNAVRARVEYLSFSEKKEVTLAWWLVDFPQYGVLKTGIKRNPNVTSVMGDWVYRANSHDKGAFLFAGAGIISSNASPKRFNEYLELIGDEFETNWAPEKSTNFGLSLGLGYHFNKHFGLEARYTKTVGFNLQEEILWTDPGGNTWEIMVDKRVGWDWAQLSVVYRF